MSCWGGEADLGAGAGALPFMGRSPDPEELASDPAPPPGLMGPVMLESGVCCGCGAGASGTWEGACCSWAKARNGDRARPGNSANAIALKRGITEITLPPACNSRASRITVNAPGSRARNSTKSPNRQSIRRAKKSQVCPTVRYVTRSREKVSGIARIGGVPYGSTMHAGADKKGKAGPWCESGCDWAVPACSLRDIDTV